ncbi:hypothetical protein KIN20_010614 [Parelaphostrongylus tenuis]|uniref:Uncharacterized protein n=1 Tax=Parelaphostrongylus tenuis TaxID=148309 RepID=A0AAD5M846_PARTN|nr:hypothetical protein KIN20_010614 [Parelaphostrongylus tenuis]
MTSFPRTSDDSGENTLQQASVLVLITIAQMIELPDTVVTVSRSRRYYKDSYLFYQTLQPVTTMPGNSII